MEGDPVCPACLSTRNHLTIEFSAEQAAQDFVQAKEYPEINLKLRSHLKRLWKGDTCEIRSCANCGMGFSWPFVSGDDVFYNLAYPTVGYPKISGNSREHCAPSGSATSHQSTSRCRCRLRVLLGPFTPARSRAEQSRGDRIQRNSIDRLRSRGYVTISDDIRSSKFNSRTSTFDYIFLFQVVEHMDQLDGLFSRLRTLTNSADRSL